MSRFHVDPSETVDVYEFDPEETLSDTPPNVITIRARMDVATAGKVRSEMVTLDDNGKPELQIGIQTGALLLHNIVSWRGPDFDGLPCTPANIRALPSADSDPFIEKVVNEIGTRNRKRESPNGRSGATINTSVSAGGAGSTMSATGAGQQKRSRSENGIAMLHSPSALDGRRSKSDA